MTLSYWFLGLAEVPPKEWALTAARRQVCVILGHPTPAHAACTRIDAQVL